jgi:hypothetical protein
LEGIRDFRSEKKRSERVRELEREIERGPTGDRERWPTVSVIEQEREERFENGDERERVRKERKRNRFCTQKKKK